MSKFKAVPLPHSWPVSDWPESVTPNSSRAGKQLVRANKDELLECGALCRVGRNLMILGEGYALFLSRKMKCVEGFSIAPNRTRKSKRLPEMRPRAVRSGE